MQRHWTEELKTWSFNYPNGTDVSKVKSCVRRLIRRQRGKEISISKVSNWVRAELKIQAKHNDLYDIMIELGAKVVNGTARNRYIFDITACLDDGCKKRNTR